MPSAWTTQKEASERFLSKKGIYLPPLPRGARAESLRTIGVQGDEAVVGIHGFTVRALDERAIKADEMAYFEMEGRVPDGYKRPQHLDQRYLGPLAEYLWKKQLLMKFEAFELNEDENGDRLRPHSTEVGKLVAKAKKVEAKLDGVKKTLNSFDGLRGIPDPPLHMEHAPLDEAIQSLRVVLDEVKAAGTGGANEVAQRIARVRDELSLFQLAGLNAVGRHVDKAWRKLDALDAGLQERVRHTVQIASDAFREVYAHRASWVVAMDILERVVRTYREHYEDLNDAKEVLTPTKRGHPEDKPYTALVVRLRDDAQLSFPDIVHFLVAYGIPQDDDNRKVTESGISWDVTKLSNAVRQRYHGASKPKGQNR